MPANESTQAAPPTDTSRTIHFSPVATFINRYTEPDDRYVVWFDIDNTLYSRSSNVLQAMQNRILGQSYSIISFSCSRIVDYILKCKLANDEASAAKLQHRLYKQYGLTIRGLVHEYDVGTF
jgi:pyrimidine and pyridine-specific 5'-nucleotidase